MIWHSASLNDLCAELQSNLNDGLSEEQARERLSENGPNFVGSIESAPLGKRLIAAAKSPVSVTLLLAAAVSWLVGAVYEASNPLLEPVVLLILYAITLAVSVCREHFCIRSIAKLKLRVSPSAKVLRGGVVRVINSVHLVPGDVILVEKGDLIPADARLIESKHLTCDESALTGHSVPIYKNSAAVLEDIASMSERSNMIHSGCVVTYGTGRAIVTATAKDTELGRLNTVEENQELSVATAGIRQLAAGIRKALPIAFAVLFLADFLCIRFTAGGDELRLLQIGASAFLYAAALLAAVSPNGLSSMAATIVTLGVHRMKRRGAIVTDVSMIDKIGKVSVVCADKASLTEPELKVSRLFCGQEATPFGPSVGESEVRLLRYAAICSDSGNDPTDTALIDAFRRVSGVSKPELENLYPRLNELPFDPANGVMATVNMIDGLSYVVVKGAPEAVIRQCADGEKEKYLAANEAFGQDALHVLAVAVKPLSDLTAAVSPTASELICDLEFVGLIGFVNPIRPDACEAVRFCKSTGTKPIMITGDGEATAVAIARQIGILTDDSQAVTGSRLHEMDDVQLSEQIDDFTVFSRITPDDKVRIVHALQSKGHVVAITGRSPVDTAALRAADVGCAMGITGTDAARNSAHVVLSDDNFSTIVAIINRGSTMYECIRKALHFAMCCSFALVLTALIGLLIWHTAVLQPVPMLFAALLFGLLPPLAFGLEPIHRRKASAKKLLIDNFFDGGRRIMVLWHGAVIALVTVIAYAIGHAESASLAGAMAYAVFVIAANVYSFSLRSRSHVFKLGLLGNPYMLIEIAASILITLLSMFSSYFGLGASVGSNAVWIAVLSLIPLIAAEAGKLVKKDA